MSSLVGLRRLFVVALAFTAIVCAESRMQLIGFLFMSWKRLRFASGSTKATFGAPTTARYKRRWTTWRASVAVLCISDRADTRCATR